MAMKPRHKTRWSSNKQHEDELNTDGDMAFCSKHVRIKWVMFLKSKIHLLLDQNTTEVKQDTSIIKLNISKLHQAVIPQTVPWKHSKFLSRLLYIT